MSVPLVTIATTAVKSLTATVQRTLLALVGIVVGIGSVTAMVSIGEIARYEAIKQFVALGTDVLSLYSFTSENDDQRRKRTPEGLLIEDLTELSKLPSIESTAGHQIFWGTLVTSSPGDSRATLLGISSNYFEMAGLEIEEGRQLSRLDGNKPFAVVGERIPEQLGSRWSSIEEGVSIQIDDVVYSVVGMLAPSSSHMSGIRPSETVFVPLGHTQRLTGSQVLTQITLRMMPGTHYLTATNEITQYFRRVAPRLDIRVDSPVRLIEQMDAQMRLFAILLGAVGSISLVVGGFGVMNALLASVNEQRMEIGIRRALGARQSDIQWQFLFQSLIFCLLGGGVGSVIGIASTFIVCIVADWSWQFSLMAPLLGLATALIVGMFFGYYPARRAAKMDPIVALRFS